MRAYIPLWLIAWFLTIPIAGRTVASAEDVLPGPRVDSIVSQIRAHLAACSSLWVSNSFIATTSERELDDDGTVKKEVVKRERVYSRGEERRAFLEAMWEDGEPVSPQKLAAHQAKREKERRKREKDDQKESAKDKDQSFGILEPFESVHAEDYDFPVVAADTVDGVPAWRIEVAPRRESEELVRGRAWVEQGSVRAIAEEYEPAKLPGKVQGMTMRISGGSTDPGCPYPRHMVLRAHGRALIFMKFRFEVEVALDSVQINPDLPDSLFTGEL